MRGVDSQGLGEKETVLFEGHKGESQIKKRLKETI